MNLLQRFKSQSDKNKVLIVTAGVGITAVGLYFFFRETDPISEWQPGRVQPKSMKERLDQIKVDNLSLVQAAKSSYAKDASKDSLEVHCLAHIQRFALEVGRFEFEKLVEQNRAARRKHIAADQAEYEKTVVAGIKEVEVAFNKALALVLTEIRADPSRYKASVQKAAQSDASLDLSGTRLYNTVLAEMRSKDQTTAFSESLALRVLNHLKEAASAAPFKPRDLIHAREVLETLVYDTVQPDSQLEFEDIHNLFSYYPTEEVQAGRRDLSALLDARAADSKVL